MKLFVSDYDETFSLDNKIKENIEAVKKWKEQGNLFVIATGRAYLDYIHLIAEPICDYVILDQGATVIDENGTILYTKIIPDEILEKIKQEYPELFQYPGNFYASILENRVSLDYGNITKMHIACNSLETAKALSEYLNRIYGDVIHAIPISRSGSMEIIASGMNKATAIAKIATLTSINSDDIYTIGDSYNDIEMLKTYHGASIKGAIEEVIAMTNCTYPSVASYIEDLLKG